MRRADWLTRNLIVLTLVSFTQDAASELLYPLLPLFVTGLLAAPPVVLGIVEGCAEAAAGISKYVAGRWSDARGRKPFVLAGYGLAAVGKVIVASALVWPTVLVGRVVDRFGKGVRSAPRDALIADSVPHEAYGRAFGFHRMGDSLGAVVGPLIGLAALTLLNGNLRAAMWVAVVPAVLSTLLVLLVREPARAPHLEAVVPTTVAAAPPPLPVDDPALTGPGAGGGTQAPAGRRSPLPGRFWRVTWVLVLIAVVNVPDALLLLRLSELGLTTTAVIWAYVLYNVVYSAGSYPGGALADRIARPYVYAIGLVAFAVGYLGLGLVTTASPLVFVLVGIYGMFPALTDGVGKAWVSGTVGATLRGRAQGVYQSLGNGAVFLAGLWGGLLWTAGPGSGVVPLVVAGAVALAAAVLLAVAGRRWERHAPA